MPKIGNLDPASYVRHAVHDPLADRPWAETNCYTDVVIELLHGLGFEPFAALPFTFTTTLDVDQWTFFKFPHADIERLFSLGIYELAPWRPLEQHLEENVAAGRPVLVELDSFYLPDTQGAAYRIAHVKSTVAVMDIDLGARTLGYFHNQGYHRLSGLDYTEVLQADGLCHPRMMPPYIECVKPLRGAAPRGAALVAASLDVLKHRLGQVPEVNPFIAFGAKFEADLDGLIAGEPELFHGYSFATLRQYGSCFWLASLYLGWLRTQGVTGTDVGEAAFAQISTKTKALQFQLARAMARKRRLDLSVMGELRGHWDEGMSSVLGRFG